MPTGLLEQGADPRYGLARSNPAQALLNQDSIVSIQWHNVSDGSQCHQVQVPDRNLRCPGQAVLLQAAANGRCQIKRNTNAGEIAAGEATAIQVGVQQDLRRG